VTAILVVAVIVLGGGLVAVSWAHFRARLRRSSRVPATSTRRILFPFAAHALSSRALDAALRLARAEDATLVPVFLARVPLHLPLDTPLPRQSNVAIPLQEAIEHRAAAFGVPVDARVQRGRTYRHALRQTIENERYDRLVIAAAHRGGPGFVPEDVAWLLDIAPGEIVALRPATDEQIVPPSAQSRRRKRLVPTQGS
jgi:nucleotide-binding universal stress UspA family protein